MKPPGLPAAALAKAGGLRQLLLQSSGGGQPVWDPLWPIRRSTTETR